MATPAADLDKMGETFGKIKEFMEVGGFTLQVTENNVAPRVKPSTSMNSLIFPKVTAISSRSSAGVAMLSPCITIYTDELSLNNVYTECLCFY